MHPNHILPPSPLSLPSDARIPKPERNPNLNQPKSFAPNSEAVQRSCAEPRKLVKIFLSEDAKITQLYLPNKHSQGSSDLSALLVLPTICGMVFTVGAITAFGCGILPLGVIFSGLAIISLLSFTAVLIGAIALSRCNKAKANSIINKEQGITPSQKAILKQKQHMCNKNINTLQMQILALKIKHDQNLPFDDKIYLLNKYAGKKVSIKDVENLKKEYKEKKCEKPSSPTPVPTPVVKAIPNPLFQELQEKLEKRKVKLRQVLVPV